MAFENLLKQLRHDYTNMLFVASDTYRWSYGDATIYFDTQHPDTGLLLHETGHGILQHSTYGADVELLKLERDAWTHAQTLAQRYGVTVHDELCEDALDSYRDWLHARSLCPACRRNGIQTGTRRYTCVLCGAVWNVNDARTCGLRRRRIV